MESDHIHVTYLFAVFLSLARSSDPLIPIEDEGQKLTRAYTEFALDLYRELSAIKEGDNIFFSPFSISSALAMTYLGERNMKGLVQSKRKYIHLSQKALSHLNI